MERLGTWLWRAHRDRFVAWVVGTIGLLVLIGIIVPAVVVGSLQLDLRRSQALIWFGCFAAVLLLTSVLTAVSLRRTSEALRRPGAAGGVDAVAAWIAMLRLPEQLGARAILLSGPLQAAISFPVGLLLADPGLDGTVALAAAFVLVTTMIGLIFTTTSQVLVRPAARELAVDVPVDSMPGHTWSVRRRLIVITITGVGVGGLFVSATVRGTAATEHDYLLALLASTAFGAYFAWLLDLLVFSPTLGPLADVVAGAARVEGGDLSEAVPVTSLDELGELAGSFNRMQRGLAERESLHAAFGSYVDPTLAQRLIDSGSSVFEGEEVRVSVMFADVRDFTSYSEGVTPSEAVVLLNRLFDVVVPIIHAHGGHANHYLGDGLLAVFGVPQALERHADEAVSAAIAIQRAVRGTLGDELRIGIGINTGSVIAGTVGGGGRLEFTVIGDTVNLASRVEALTKETGDAILITEATRTNLSPPRRGLRSGASSQCGARRRRSRFTPSTRSLEHLRDRLDSSRSYGTKQVQGRPEGHADGDERRPRLLGR